MNSRRIESRISQVVCQICTDQVRNIRLFHFLSENVNSSIMSRAHGDVFVRNIVPVKVTLGWCYIHQKRFSVGFQFVLKGVQLSGEFRHRRDIFFQGKIINPVQCQFRINVFRLKDVISLSDDPFRLAKQQEIDRVVCFYQKPPGLDRLFRLTGHVLLQGAVQPRGHTQSRSFRSSGISSQRYVHRLMGHTGYNRQNTRYKQQQQKDRYNDLPADPGYPRMLHTVLPSSWINPVDPGC